MNKLDFLKNKYAKIGFWGTMVAAICCFTPLLVWIFAAAGLTTYVAYLDYILLPVLVIFLALLVFGWKRYNRTIKSNG